MRSLAGSESVAKRVAMRLSWRWSILGIVRFRFTLLPKGNISKEK
jgi:hypothetical protein